MYCDFRFKISVLKHNLERKNHLDQINLAMIEILSVNNFNLMHPDVKWEILILCKQNVLGLRVHRMKIESKKKSVAYIFLLTIVIGRDVFLLVDYCRRILEYLTTTSSKALSWLFILTSLLACAWFQSLSSYKTVKVQFLLECYIVHVVQVYCIIIVATVL